MNNKFVKTLLCTFWIWGISGHTAIASAASHYPLSYAAAIEFALANRVDLAIEKANAKRAEAGLGEAKAAFLPSVEVATTMERIKTYDKFTGVDMVAHYNGAYIPVDVRSVTPGYQINPGIELKYNLYSGGADKARLHNALASKDAAEGQQAYIKKKIILDVTTAYWEFRKQQIEYQIAERNRDYAREELAFNAEQFRQGAIARIELDGKVFSAETRETQLRTASRRLADAQRRYLYALGMTPVSTSSQANNTPLLADHPSHLDIDRLLARIGAAAAPEMTIAQADYAGAKARLEQVRAEYRPSVDFYARYNGNGRSDNNFSDATSDLRRGSASIGVRFRWNLFDGYRTDYRTAQALTSSEQMELRINQTRRELDSNWFEKQSHEAEARDQVLLAQKQRDLAAHELVIAKKRLETKTISNLQFRAAQLALEEAERKETVAEIDLLLASVALRLAQPWPDTHSDTGKQDLETKDKTMSTDAVEMRLDRDTRPSGISLKMAMEIELRSMDRLHADRSAP